LYNQYNDMFCVRCKKKTSNKSVTHHQTANMRHMAKAICGSCGSKKCRFISGSGWKETLAKLAKDHGPALAKQALKFVAPHVIDYAKSKVNLGGLEDVAGELGKQYIAGLGVKKGRGRPKKGSAIRGGGIGTKMLRQDIPYSLAIGGAIR
jgi:hypothetical protein